MIFVLEKLFTQLLSFTVKCFPHLYFENSRHFVYPKSFSVFLGQSKDEMLAVIYEPACKGALPVPMLISIEKCLFKMIPTSGGNRGIKTEQLFPLVR